MTPPRRDFLGILGAATLTGAIAPRGIGATTAPARPIPTWFPRPRSVEWDMSWLKRLNGKYRAVFDGPEVSEGDPILRAVIWGHQMAEVFMATKAEMSKVLVLRHNGIELAMGDAYWARFDAAERHGFTGADGRPLRVNPMRTARAEVPEMFRHFTIEQFVADGGIVLSCDLALRHYVVPRYVALGMSEDAAYAAAVRDMIPGIIPQPSGIFAVSVAQDAGCSFVPVG